MADNEMRFEFTVNLKKVWFQKRPAKVLKGLPMNLKKSLILAYQIERFIKENKIKSLLELGRWTNMSQSRICQFMKLLLLATDIQSEIIQSNDGKIASLTEKSVRKIPMQTDWDKQREMWNDCK